MCFKEAAQEHAKAVKATVPMFRIAMPPISIGRVALSYQGSTELIKNEVYTEEAPLRFMGQDVFQPLSLD